MLNKDFQVLKQIFTGPGSAMDDLPRRKRPVRPGNAEIVGQKEVTPEMIAYACIQVSFAFINICFLLPAIFLGPPLSFDAHDVGRMGRRFLYESFLLRYPGLLRQQGIEMGKGNVAVVQ